MLQPKVESAAVAWREARLKACAAPMGDKAVWTDLGAAETALSEAVEALGDGGVGVTERWTPQQVEALADAMWQLLDDMEAEGTSVCAVAKAAARVAYEPFRVDANGEEAPVDYPLEAAERLQKEVQQELRREINRPVTFLPWSLEPVSSLIEVEG